MVTKKATKLPSLSRTEWRIMNYCWSLGEATAREVHEASLAERRREYRTVKTLLDRIAAKGYLEVENRGRALVFRPVVGRSAAWSEAVSDFVNVVLDRSAPALYLHLAEREDLSDEEIEFFRRQLAIQEERAKSEAGDDEGSER